MNSQIVNSFRDGSLRPSSSMRDVPYIGPYLHEGLRRVFAPGKHTITINRFARSIELLERDVVMEKIQRALQNARANRCVRNPTPYHIPDVNTMAWRSVVTLVRIMSRGDDGYGLGRRFQFDARRLRMPTNRQRASKSSACLTRRECATRRDSIFSDGLCMPLSRNTKGFDGVGNHPGQKTSKRTRYSRGAKYARHPSGRCRWRRPSRQWRLRQN